MNPINGKDETLLSICAESPGCFELDLDAGEPHAHWVLARISQQGGTRAALASDDGKNWADLEFRCWLACPDRDIANKMRADCLRLVTIVQKCKFKISTSWPQNAIDREDKNAFNSSYIYGGLGITKLWLVELCRHPQTTLVSLGKPPERAYGQVAAMSLEWIHRGKLLNMA